MREELSTRASAESVAQGLTGPSLSFDLAAETQALLNSPLWQLGGHTALLSLSGAPSEPSGHADEFEALAKEHLNFSRLLGVLETQIALFHRGEQPDYELVQDVFFYLTNYPDRFHHPKEDRVFALIAQRVPLARGHVEEIARQHRQIAESGARFLASLNAVLNGAMMPREAVERPALEYIALYRKHMAFEEQELFPLGKAHLSAADWIDANVSTRPEEDPLFGDRVEERYHELHRRIAREAGCGCA